MADPLIGRQIDQYEIISLIGHGGMAAVYRAYQPGMKRDVAMKVLSDALVREPNFVARFAREVELAATLEHAHIVPVFDHGTAGEGLLYLTMRYIKGGTLAERIKQGPMPLETAASILQQIAGALDYAHQRGVVHRDIKPSNVLIDEQGNAYLDDFGLAQVLDPDLAHNLTQTGTLVGTPTYISPEQALEARGDARSDLYSLGIVLYEMLTGRPPFTGDSMFNIMRAHISEPPPSVLRFRPNLPMAVESVLEKALAKKPEQRYKTATEMARDFALAIQGNLITPRLPSSQTILVSTASTLTNIIRNQPRVGLFTVGLVLIVLAGLGLLVAPGLITQPTPTAPPTTIPTRLMLTATPTFSSLLPMLAPESSRPASGPTSALALTDQEVRTARQRLQDSFVGIMACTLETEYHASLVRSARLRANALSLPVQVADSRTDRFRQPAIINRFIAEGAYVIIICPLDETILAPAVRAAQDAGVVIISIGDTVYGRAAVALTLTNETMGRAVAAEAAAYINEELGGTATVAILDYPPVPGVVVRADAMARTLRELAPGATIVGRYQGGLPDDGQASMARALAEHPGINVILSINDAGAFGAVDALRAAGRGPDEVSIFSVDAEAEARRMIRDGEYFRASLDNDPVGTASLMVDAAVKMLAGSVVPRQILISGNMVTRNTLLATPGAP
jgi:serine/threonine protein kinase/DNA-binding LacI/PurR family transcriptional regulator